MYTDVAVVVPPGKKMLVTFQYNAEFEDCIQVFDAQDNLVRSRPFPAALLGLGSSLLTSSRARREHSFFEMVIEFFK